MAKYPPLLVMTFGSASLVDDAGHPNKMKFHGVLVRLDEPSTKPPNGSNGHRILVPSGVAKRVIKSLINMGLNYSPSLETHAQKRKVGTITKAWIDGKDLCIDAIVWKHDFPEAEQDLKQPGLGMSMEIGDVHVENENAEVWKLSDFCFLGATILWKNSAAYYRTQAIAANKEGRKNMAKAAVAREPVKKPVQITSKELRLLVASAAGTAVEKALGSIGPTIGRQSKILANLATRLDDIELKLTSGKTITTEADDEEEEDNEITAAGFIKGKHQDGCTGKDCEGCMTSAKKPEPDDDDDDDDDEDGEEDIDAVTVGDIDKGDLEDLGPDSESEDDPDDEPGHINQGTKNKGNKTTSEDKVGKHVSDGVTSARLKNALKANKQMAVDIAELKAQVGNLTKTVRRQAKQMAAAGEQNRRSIDPSTIALLSKSGIDPRELQASGQKMTVAEVDAVLTASGLNLGPVERMTAKNRLLQDGLMEDGVVSRG